MHYYSTNRNSATVNFREAAIKGQPPDKGLYFPESIPTLPQKFFDELKQYSKEEIALQVISPYVGDTIPVNVLQQIVSETISFDFPLKQVNEFAYALELFHGPTLAFKDVGARFMSRCLEYFMRNSNKKTIVLTATSGDTGGAVAHGFYKAEGIDVVILYPSGKVSDVQEWQLTRLGHNIHALEVNGSFDDCQRLVKQAFADEQLNNELTLSSANSINIARWLPQQFYYFFALQQWPYKEPPVISVPSGNFGNICAGLVAHRSGLPVKQFIAACNENDTVPEYFQSGNYHAKKSVATLSNAMDVGDPSNFVRLQELYNGNIEGIKKEISSYSTSDEETIAIIKEVFSSYNYLPDPHGAVAYSSLKKYLNEHAGAKGIFLETAHPVKFRNVVEPITGKPVELPSSVAHLQKEKKQAIGIESNYEELRDFLVERF
jgi:threonine synthase